MNPASHQLTPAKRTSSPSSKVSSRHKRECLVSVTAMFKEPCDLKHGTSNVTCSGKKNGKNCHHAGSGDHPLSEAFNKFRVGLYKSAATRIYETYDSLLHELRDANFEIGDAWQNTSKPRFLYQPIGATILRFGSQSKNGEPTTVTMELGRRISFFEAHIQKEYEELLAMQAEWDTIMSEIRRCGERVLGKDAIETLFFTQTSNQRPEQQHVPASMFVSESGDNDDRTPSTGRPLGKCKKRVSAAESLDSPLLEFTSNSHSPAKQSLPAYPVPRPQEQLKVIHTGIRKLGSEELTQLRRLDKEQQKWYDKKVQQVVDVWGEEEDNAMGV